MEKELRSVAKGSRRRAPAEATSSEATGSGPARRFSASRLAAHRSKLDLSAAAYGKLAGVSGQTIYNWEQGKARPRPAQLQQLAAVRELSRREAAARLDAE